MKKRCRFPKYLFLNAILIVMLTFVIGNTAVSAQTGSTTYYIDATGGNDSNNGTSPSSAWKTVFKVNDFEFNPGDSILFKRGDVWRGLLIVPSSGDTDAYITFGAYGTGEKPLLLGSAEKNDASDWKKEGNNIWSTVDSKDGNEIFSNPSFDENLDNWFFYTGDGANASLRRDTENYDSAPASARIDCANNNDGKGSILFVTKEYSINENEWYIVSYRAKGSSSFNIFLPPRLIKNGVGTHYYSISSNLHNMPVSTEWTTYNFYYLANTNANDVAVLLDLASIPNGESLYIDTLSFQKCDDTPLSTDVGSLIFNGEESVGAKVANEDDLDTQGEFWFNAVTGRLKMYSTSNPASYYSDIECALGNPQRHIITIRGESHIIVENLDLRYGGAHGIRIEENAHNIIIRDCDISYIGGSIGTYSEHEYVRFGNGVEIWENGHDCTVEGCKLGEIYDAAITNQGEKTNNQYNLYYRNNLIWNSEYSFEIWDKPESSSMSNIYIEDNVCIGAGFGWSHKQRPDHNGWHLLLTPQVASTENIIIRDNVFYEAAFSALYKSKSEMSGLMLDYNYYYQKSGEMFAFRFDTKYTMEQFSEYQSEKGYDLHSVTGDKEVVQEAARGRTREEDIALLNELLNTTDELEATKNEGVTLEQAIYADETPEPETQEPETSELETPEPEVHEPETSDEAGGIPGFPITALIFGLFLTALAFYNIKKH